MPIEFIPVYVDKNGRRHQLADKLPINPESGALITLDSSEAAAHAGHGFTVEAVDASMANSDTLIIAFKTVLTFNVGKNRSVRQTSFGSEIRTEHHENS